MRKIGIAELEAAMAVARRRSFRAASSDLSVSPTVHGFIPSSAGLCLYYPSRRYQPAGLRALISFIHDVCRSGRI
jgi:DNA-binding transcriptional LysR family regulator